MKKKKIEPVVYVGPGFKSLDIATFKIYADGIPKEYVADPVYKRLFVRPDELDKARKEIAKSGTLLNTLYKQAEKKGGK